MAEIFHTGAVFMFYFVSGNTAIVFSEIKETKDKSHIIL